MVTGKGRKTVRLSRLAKQINNAKKTGKQNCGSFLHAIRFKFILDDKSMIFIGTM
jgi:hypothetical protein